MGRRPRVIDLATRIYAAEAAEIVGISIQQLNGLVRYGKLPRAIGGRYVLKEFLRVYIKHVESAAIAAVLKTRTRELDAWQRAQRPAPPAAEPDPMLRDISMPDVW